MAIPLVSQACSRLVVTMIFVVACSGANAQVSDQDIATRAATYRAEFLSAVRSGGGGFERIASAALAGLETRMLSSEQIAVLDAAGTFAFASEQARTEILNRLRGLAAARDSSGALAAGLGSTFRVSRPTPPDFAPAAWVASINRDLATRFYEHPSRDQVLRSKWGAVGVVAMLQIHDGEEALPASRFDEILVALGEAPSPDAAAIASELVFAANTLSNRASDPVSSSTIDQVEAVAVSWLTRGAQQERKAGRESAAEEHEAAIKAIRHGQRARQMIGKRAPSLQFDWVSDQSIDSFESLEGKVVLLDFWATWCAPCIAAFPDLATLREDFSPERVAIIGVTSYRKSPSDLSADEIEGERDYLQSFARERKVSWTLAALGGGVKSIFLDEYGVDALPHIAVIDTEGRLRYNWRHTSEHDLGAIIRELLDESGEPSQ